MGRSRAVCVCALVAVVTLGLGACENISRRVTTSGGVSKHGRRAQFDASSVDLRLTRVARGLSSPLQITHAADGSKRLFVAEQDGLVRIIRKGALRSTPFLDITSLTEASGEQGLLGLAFHPNYSTTGRLFVNYTDLNGDTVVAEYRRAKQNPGRADPKSARVLLTIDQPFPNHNGGDIKFGPDGYLYIATGDGGSAGDPMDNGQSLSTLLGKLLRIDVDSPSGGRAYGIPADNPFVDREGARPEIYDYGLRNPWRFSFDRATGDLWIADVGQDRYEEINVARSPNTAGLNFGWNIMEAHACYEPSDGCRRKGLEMPVAAYPHSKGCSVSGGFVYRGTSQPALSGGYFYGDYCSGIMWALNAKRPNKDGPAVVLRSGHNISTFGENEAGELFMADLSSGEIFKLKAKGN
jgi:glucose/arabinose dehydrogenase